MNFNSCLIDMPEYSYDKDDQRFGDSRSYYDFDEREWITHSEARDRSTEYFDRPSSKPWWMEMGVDMPDAPPIDDRTQYQDPYDDDMSRLQRPITDSIIDFFLYDYIYRDSQWPVWND